MATPSVALGNVFTESVKTPLPSLKLR